MKVLRIVNQQMARIGARDGWECSYCGVEIAHLPQHVRAVGDGFVCVGGFRFGVIDHRVPRSKGGTNDPHNLVLACGSCNSIKGARDEAEFRLEAATFV
jgi:hypothetical protein